MAIPAWDEERALEVGKRIAAARKGKGWSIDQVGEMLGVSRGTVGHWERGTRAIKLEDLVPLCAVLGASADDLLFGRLHWPFQKADYRVVSELEPQDIARLEGAMLLVAAQHGIEVEKRADPGKEPPKKLRKRA